MLNLPRFYTFAVSHYCEKARWAMDYVGINYDEQPLTPILHVPTLLKHSKNPRKTTVPLLVDGDTKVHGSSNIVQWAHERAEASSLLGSVAKPGKSGKISQAQTAKMAKQRAEIEDVIQRYDGTGHHIRRFCYAHLLQDRKNTLMVLTWASAPAQTLLLKLYYPAVKKAIEKAYDINPESAARSEQVIFSQLNQIAETVEKTGYLCGKQFTAADLSVASLLAPVAMPDGHPVYCSMRGAATPEIMAMSNHPAMDWVREIYKNHRDIHVV